MSWIIENKKLVKEFNFDNFITALDFVNKVGEIAEQLQHHPDILIYSYNKVKISTYTHDQNKITQKDKELTEKIEEIISSFSF